MTWNICPKSEPAIKKKFVGAKGRIMGYHLKQTAKELIFVQDEVRGMKQAKGTLEVLAA